MNILVTGSAGMIGGYVVRGLMEKTPSVPLFRGMFTVYR